MKRIQLVLLVFLIGIGCKTQKNALLQKSHYISDVEGSYVFVNSDVQEEDAKIKAMIAPYADEMSEEMNEVLGTVENAMYKGRPSSSLGNWLTDILKVEAELINNVKVDFALQNYGGIRVGSVEPGPMTVSKVFEIMPFDNELVTLKAKGSIVMELCSRIAEKGGWPASDGLKMSISNNKAIDVMVNGKPLNMNQEYVIALPDYIANGGDNCFFLADLEITSTKKMIRDIMITHLRRNNAEGKPIRASEEKRVIQL